MEQFSLSLLAFFPLYAHPALAAWRRMHQVFTIHFHGLSGCVLLHHRKHEAVYLLVLTTV